MTDETEATYPEKILASLNLEERRMVFANKVESGGEGVKSWRHKFGLDTRIWQMTSTNPEPHLNALGKRVYYALIADADAMRAVRGDEA